MKESARAKELDRDAARGKSGVALGNQIGNQKAWQNQCWEEGGTYPRDTPEQQSELNAANQAGKKGKKGKGKGKG